MSLPFEQDWAKTLEAKPAIAASWRSLDSIFWFVKESEVEKERGAGLSFWRRRIKSRIRAASSEPQSWSERLVEWRRQRPEL